MLPLSLDPTKLRLVLIGEGPAIAQAANDPGQSINESGGGS